jgi:hypothetical protein
MSENQLIIVLGMHRSGTSAITRGLTTMGVDLGDNLLQPQASNSKGFWEDLDFVVFNDELLAALGQNWNSMTPIAATMVDLLRMEGYLLRAVELLRRKMAGTALLGLKDPRMAKLLPFWRAAIDYCQVRVSYVLALRHPLSVVRSLAVREGFDAEKSYLMWLGHVISALAGSGGAPRVLVDFDLLMRSPDYELNRIAARLGLAVDAEQLRIYTSDFLEQDLRHTIYELSDLSLDSCCPPLVREVYATLLNVASDKMEIDGPLLQRHIRGWTADMDRWRQSLILADRYNERVTEVERLRAEDCQHMEALKEQAIERDANLASLRQEIGKRDDHIEALRQEVGERQGKSAELAQTIAERDRELEALRGDIHDRETWLAELEHAVLAKDRDLESSKIAAGERETWLAELEQTVAVGNQKIAELEIALDGRDAEIADLKMAVDGQNARLAEHVVALEQLSARETMTAERNMALLAEQAAKLEASHRERVEIENKLFAIENGTAWKLTYPLRSLVDGSPAVRRFARRSAKLTWWAATGTLSRQLRQRRARRSGTNPLSIPPSPEHHLIDLQMTELLSKGAELDAVFDRAWYLQANPDVRAAGADPLFHYLASGASEGRNPSPRFDTNWYLETYSDVRETNLNPLLHYVLFGKQEGRLPLPTPDLA